MWLRSYLGAGPAVLTADDVVGAHVQKNPGWSDDKEAAPPASRYFDVILDLSPSANARFEAFCRSHLRHYLAFIVRGEVTSAPIIVGPPLHQRVFASVSGTTPNEEREEVKLFISRLGMSTSIPPVDGESSGFGGS